MKRVTLALAVLSVVACTSARVGAQQRWSWPEKAKNLKVLPKDTSAEQLRDVMRSFSHGLGVHCAHCHVGEEGKPLSTYDFPSDKKKAKETARIMLRMVGDVHHDLEKVDTGDKPKVEVNCYTCHHGRPRPVTLVDELMGVYASDGLAAAIDRYHELRDRYYGASAYDFTERSLNEMGYRLLGKGAVDGAIAVLRLNATEYPQSGNVFDSLAEAYATAGRNDLAEIYYKKSLALDPDNRHALRKLHELEGGTETPGESEGHEGGEQHRPRH